MKACHNCGKKYSDKLSDKKGKIDIDFDNRKWKIQSLMGHIDDEMDPINELNICPDCYSLFLEEEKPEKKDKTRKSDYK